MTIKDDFEQLRTDLFGVTSKPYNGEGPPPNVQRASLVQNFIDTHNVKELGFFDRKTLNDLINEFKDAQTAEAGSGAKVDRGRGPETPSWRR